MLHLKNINKDYIVGNQIINALKDVNISFRKNEFVAILGPSGCGKTTMLNILGGLDRYTSGDLIINGRSTKEFTDSDWDAYRNRSIGFVLQNYYLIPHLSVLKNVELAPILAGVSKARRREKAIEVLNMVGLADQLHKKPNQLSGGQMQRVSVARALVNDPDIILADEPTGALDSKNSIQIADLLKEISKERLVIMVTHNENLASLYATRTINLFDGEVIDDTDKAINISQTAKVKKKEKTSMSLPTALSLSAANLWTKKMRTLLTSFASSIGIIGIALILAISSGLSTYIDEAQAATLATLPLMILPSVDLGDEQLDKKEQIKYEIYPNEHIIYPYQRSTSDYSHLNTISLDFENYVSMIDSSLYNAISFIRGTQLNLMTSINDSYRYLSKARIRWTELLNNDEYMQYQYDVLDGTYPSEYNQIALVVDKYNRLPKTIIDELGMDYDVQSYTFADFIGLEIKVIPNDLYYTISDETGNFIKVNSEFNESLYQSEDAIPLKISGILRLNPETTTELVRPGIAYLQSLTDYMLEVNYQSLIVAEQLKYGIDKDVFTGLPFKDTVTPTVTISKTYYYELQLQTIGATLTSTSIAIYPKTFEAKNQIKLYLDGYNIDKEGSEQVLYTDYSESLSKTIGKVVSAVTYVLIAFSSISLIVSSIMIGIITYISVIERIKEIGLLRSLGARKKDISRVFIAETMLIGLVSGLIGVGIAFILTFPINQAIEKHTEVASLGHVLPLHALILISISIFLTLIAGFIPARIASKKDPVIALRTE